MTRRLSHDGTEESPVAHAALTEPEREVLPAAFRYAARHDLATPPDEAYRRELARARRSVLERLLGGLARDAPQGIPAPETVDATTGATGEVSAELPGVPDGRAPSERVPHASAADSLLAVPFPEAEATVVAPVLATRAFGRFQFGPRAVTCRPEGVAPVDTPETVATLLAREGVFPTAEDAKRFRSEVGESVANLALARLGRRVLWADLEGGPRPTASEPRPAADASAYFDRLVTGGHPIHPGAKLRRGMSATESLSFAPEFTGSIPLRFVAVRETDALTVAGDGSSLTERLYETFPGLAAAVAAAVPTDRHPDDFAVLPVHPWQFRHVLPDRYAEARRAGRVVPIPSYSRSASPLLSLRTVVPDPAETAVDTPPHLKLAIGVQTTNAVRTLSPSVVADGPRLSRVVERACANTSVERFGVRRESAAACYHPPGGPHRDGEGYDDARHLGALLREHPAAHPVVGGGERAVTAASLLACPPPGERSVLAAVLDAYAGDATTGERAEAVELFLAAYVDAVVPGPLGLLVRHGIGLEAHLQNTDVVFDDGRPVASLVGDFGDVRICEPRLGDDVIDPYPGSDVLARDPAAAREKLWYALFQNHLGELVGRLTATEPASGADCWSVVRRRCERVFDRLASDGSVPDDRVAVDRESLFSPRLPHKPLTAMRIRGDDGGRPSTTVANPLSAGADRRGDGE